MVLCCIVFSEEQDYRLRAIARSTRLKSKTTKTKKAIKTNKGNKIQERHSWLHVHKDTMTPLFIPTALTMSLAVRNLFARDVDTDVCIEMAVSLKKFKRAVLREIRYMYRSSKNRNPVYEWV